MRNLTKKKKIFSSKSFKSSDVKRICDENIQIPVHIGYIYTIVVSFSLFIIVFFPAGLFLFPYIQW